ERCFRASKLEMVLMDDGFLPGQIRPIDWHDRFFPVRRLVRVEALAEDLLTAAADFDDFLERFRNALDPPPPNVVGFKSIIAYRSGLNVWRYSAEQVRAAWERWKQTEGPRSKRPRLAEKHLLDFLLDVVMELAAKHRLPVQFHSGFGDPDLDLRTANPLHLRPLFEDPRFKQAAIVLLHASYPFTQEAGYLASVYPHVYLDTGLAVPFLSVSGMRETTRMLLELAPTDKLL